MEQSYYSVLGIQKCASAEEIKAAYRRLLLTQHPDKSILASSKIRGPSIQVIKRAYEVLSDQNKRLIYDKDLHKTEILSGVLDHESVDIIDLSKFKEIENSVTDEFEFRHDCPRCNVADGFILTERNLDDSLNNPVPDTFDSIDSNNSHLLVQCSSCSLWICVTFSSDD